MANGEAFEIELEVRDYECDLQGIVNNAVYQHYLEHARHRFLRALGLDFAELHERGADAVVHRVELDYRMPLRSGDRFIVRSSVRRQGIMRFVFEQEVLRLPDRDQAARGLVTAAFMSGGRPIRPPADVAAALEGAGGRAPPLTS
ncbi:MAG TPA: acyl-CoA thioesterase [Rectinemataceae bacterium]|nr:acyl-CoA thioesterase [Rectinemataceae bacterium]